MFGKVTLAVDLPDGEIRQFVDAAGVVFSATAETRRKLIVRSKSQPQLVGVSATRVEAETAKRKHRVEWRDLLPRDGVAEKDVMDIRKRIDLRAGAELTRASIVAEK